MICFYFFDQFFGIGLLVHFVSPSAQSLDVDGGIGVNGLHAQSERVDAGAGLSILGAEGGHVADVVYIVMLKKNSKNKKEKAD